MVPNDLAVPESHVAADRSAIAAIEESKAHLTAATTEAHAKLADIVATAAQATSAKTQITDAQSVIAAKSEHIQKAQEHADSVRANLDRTLTAANLQATEAEGEKSKALAAANTAAEQLANIKATKAASDADAAAIAQSKKLGEDSAAATKALAEKAATIEAQIAAYEHRLADLAMQSATQLEKIVSLLPGATSAGLAHAFDERRQTFLNPQRRWENWFIGSVIALVLIAAASLLQIYLDPKMTWEGILLLWLSRLPLAGALIWLAIHASHEAALAKRLEEDYGYKSAVAATFLGFQKQMSELPATPDTPLGKLCVDTLATIAAPPGRIYEGQKLTASPGSEVTDAAKIATAFIPKQIAK